ncbi:MAG: hypothetical protein LAT80_04995 [Balneolaceae bacterium]|nr:hypothetical protein [Balneolaceae bacterium]
MIKLLKIAPLFLLLALAGCVTPVKQGWYNFTAYYNTFYNAQQYFSEGLELNRAQTLSLDPNVPLRIHRSPSQGGADQFAEAIERGASILRNHEKSRYVEPSLLLIGQSYYYRSEFFSALETFQDLQAISSGENLKKSLIWQGRTYLEMGNHSQGVRFLESESAMIDEWDPALEAELYALLAQFHAELGNLQTASEYLHFSAGRIEDREMKVRAYFLHGQILEMQGFDAQALAAFRISSESRADFDIQYHSLKKQAEMARNVGDFDRALSLYSSMIRNDNFIDYREELRFEAAYTYQIRGDTDGAIERYNRLISDRFEPPSELTRTKVYFSLGEIYRDDLDNFPLAAAYFDSASAQSADRSLLPNRMNISEMANSFGEYASLKREITHRDSLLHLGGLEPDQFDAAIAEIQQRLALEAEELQEEQRQREDRFLVSDAAADTVVAADQIGEQGFLNIRNRVMLTDASLQFQAVWGDRALQDNWRRRSAVSGSRFDQIFLSDGETEVEEATASETEAAAAAALDLSEIPMTEEARTNMRMEREGYQYRLGNLFFLSFEMPDSARYYFSEVIESGLNPGITERALYSLAELELTQGRDEEADRLATQLAGSFPESQYTFRIMERTGRPQPLSASSGRGSLSQNYMRLHELGDEKGAIERANELVALAEEMANERQRPLLLFEATRSFIDAAREEPGHRQKLREWNREESAADSARIIHEVVRDSARVKLAEVAGELSDEERRELETLAEGEFVAPQRSAEFPFEGELWDSARDLLNRIVDDYPQSAVAPRADAMLTTIKPPSTQAADTSRVVATMAFPEDRFPEEPAPKPTECREMGFVPDMNGGYEAFFAGVNYPQWAHDAEFRGAITYRIEIGAEGEILSYEPVRSIDRSGVPEAIEQAIGETLRFTPEPDGGRAVCHLTFEIDLGN